MFRMTKEISLDQPLLKQAAVRDILFPEKEGLIPNLMLERILEITRILVQNQLNRKFSSYELANLVVGYDVFTKDENGEIPEQTPQLFSVKWNDSSVTGGLGAQQNDNPIFNEFTSSLFSSLQQVIIELLPRFIGNKTVSIYLSLIVAKKQASSTPILTMSPTNVATPTSKAMSSTGSCRKCKGKWKKVISGQCSDTDCWLS